MAIIRVKNEASYTFKAGAYGGDKLKVVAFSGSEGISELFRFSVELASTDAGVDFEKILGAAALLTIQGDKEKRSLHGMVNRFEQSGKKGKWTFYRAGMVPAIWWLSQTAACRVFQNLPVPDILKKVFADKGIPADQVRFSLKGTYPSRDYCVQYRESDLAFVTRLMEEVGLFYFFEHTAEKHVLVIGDDPVVHVGISGGEKVSYRAPGTAGVSDQEHVSEFQWRQEIRTGAAELRDYDFKKPNLHLAQDAKAKKKTDGEDKLEFYDFPGKYVLPAEGGDLVKVRLEALRATRQLGSGRSDCRRLLPGYRFTLEQFDRSELNREYLLTRVSQSGSQPQVLGGDAPKDDRPLYENAFECIPSDTPFRPARSVPRPSIRGSQTAVVVGPKGEEIYTDEHGRIKVQFHWDREGKKDEKSSCWVRVKQAWAGAGWGMVFLPRIGHEVLVEFLEGDPDQPVVVGSLYNGENVPPYPLPAEKTKSTIKSNSSTGGEGSNEIRFEDAKGSEEIYLHGQKDWTIAIENDKNQQIGHDETLTVGNDRSKKVEKNQTEEIGENKTITVGKDHTETISGGATIDIAKNETVSVGENQDLTVGKNQTVSVGENQTISAGKNLSETVGENADVSIGKNLSLNVSKSSTSQIGENFTGNVSKKASVEVGEDTGLTVGKKLNVQATDAISITSDKEIVLKAGDASITLKKNGDIIVKGNKISVKADGDIVMKGSKITQN